MYCAGSAEDSIEDDDLYLNFGIFIDGTLNNIKYANTKKQKRN